MTDIDTQLREYAERWQRWQEAQPPPPGYQAFPTFRLLGGTPRRSPRSQWSVVGAVAIAIALCLAVVFFLDRRATGNRVAIGTRPSEEPVAKAPLLTRPLLPTQKVILATGGAGAVTWKFFAQAGKWPGFCLGFDTQDGSGSGCFDPRAEPALDLKISQVDQASDILLIYGVTSAPAGSFSLTVGTGASISLPALSNPALTGLRFFVTQLPARSIPVVFPPPIRVDALDRDGPILRNDPKLTSPLPPPPPATPPAPPGTYPLWPIDPARLPALTSPTAAARDFATQDLGLANPTITPDPKAAPGGPTVVKIHLPAAGNDLAVVTFPRPDGSWGIDLVGDEGKLQGITMRPNGVFGPVMSLLPPDGATTADVTETAADGVHEIHLTKSDLSARVVHLVGEPIHTVLVIYRDTSDGVLAALGGEYG